MELFKRIPVDFSFEDARGSLTQLVHEGYEQINVLTTKAGVIRGGHYHKRTVESFYIIDGSVKIELEKDGEKVIEQFVKDDFFCIVPYVWHTMVFEKDTVMVAMYEKKVEQPDGTKDIFSE